MKSKFVLLGIAVVATLYSFTFGNIKPETTTSVTFIVLGNGKNWVYLSVGTELGKGPHHAVAKTSRIFVTGKAGDTLWDRELKKAITTVTSTMGGKTVDLKNYY